MLRTCRLCVESVAVSESLVRELRRVLNHLYDWTELRSSPLIDLVGLDQQRDPASALQRALIEAIESLRPRTSVAAKARAWRTYHVLHARFVEQFTQREVAGELGLSIRHLRRAEASALSVLAAYLSDRYGLDGRPLGERVDRPAPEADAGSAPGRAPTRAQELAWLQQSQPSEPVGAQDLICGQMELARSLAREAQVDVDCRLPDGLPDLLVRLTPTREALLNVFVAAVRSVPNGQVAVRAHRAGTNVAVTVRAIAADVAGTALGGEELDRLEMARQLLALSEGTVTTTRDGEGCGALTVDVVLPAEEQTLVLVIDDNTEALQLLERYLVNSRFRFLGVSEPRDVLRVAEEACPHAIVLDVMLPGIDGWELLGRLREHPSLRGAPIIVCTILPQEELAVSLGAAAFLRKPVSRKTFLLTLERVLAPRATESG